MEGVSAPERRASGWLAIALGALAIVLLLAHSGFGLLSEDSAALAYAAEHGPWADWLGPQYDLRVVRFWRPLVTWSLAAQERIGGTDAIWLRSLNLVCHGTSVAVLVLLAAELGAGRLGAALCGLAAATTPCAGGAVLWVVGRVDALCVALFLCSVLLALRGHTLLSLAAGFLALATKEQAVVLPAWIFLLALGRGDAWRRAARLALPSCALVAAYFGLRFAALGTAIGGYSGAALSWRAVPAALRAWLHAFELTVVFGSPLLLMSMDLGIARLRPAAAAIGAALLAAAPLLHVLAPGEVAREHLRTLYLSDLGLCLAGGCLLARAGAIRALFGRRTFGLIGFLGLLAVLGGMRVSAQLDDLGRWREAGLLASAIEVDVRFALDGAAASSRPVVVEGVPRAVAGAYVYQWGFAERFAPPFEPTARPAWPWRNVYALGEAERGRPLVGSLLERRLGGAPRPIVDPFQAAAGPLELSAIDERAAPGTAAPGTVSVDERLLEGLPADAAPPRLLLRGLAEVASIEWLLLTPIGYEPGGSIELSGGGPAAIEVELREVLLRPVGDGFARLSDALLDALDTGAREQVLELRAMPRAGGDPWVAHLGLAIDPALRDRARPLR